MLSNQPRPPLSSFRVESGLGPSGEGLLSYLRANGAHFQLFAQLRPLSFP